MPSGYFVLAPVPASLGGSCLGVHRDCLMNSSTGQKRASYGRVRKGDDPLSVAGAGAGLGCLGALPWVVCSYGKIERPPKPTEAASVAVSGPRG